MSQPFLKSFRFVAVGKQFLFSVFGRKKNNLDSQASEADFTFSKILIKVKLSNYYYFFDIVRVTKYSFSTNTHEQL